MIIAMSFNMDSIVSAFVALLAIVGFVTIREQFKEWWIKRRELKAKENETFDPETYEPELPQSSEMEVLDTKVQKLLTENIERNVLGPSVTGESYTRASLRFMIAEEIAFRVKREALNPDLEKLRPVHDGASARSEFSRRLQMQEERDAKRAAKVAELQKILLRNRIPYDWVLKNGNFEAKPPHLPFSVPPSLGRGGPSTLSGTLLQHEKRCRQIEYECMMSFKHHKFGGELPCSSIDEISDRDIDILLQHKDALIDLFRASRE
jgi:hypothetical protein